MRNVLNDNGRRLLSIAFWLSLWRYWSFLAGGGFITRLKMITNRHRLRQAIIRLSHRLSLQLNPVDRIPQVRVAQANHQVASPPKRQPCQILALARYL